MFAKHATDQIYSAFLTNFEQYLHKFHAKSATVRLTRVFELSTTSVLNNFELSDVKSSS